MALGSLFKKKTEERRGPARREPINSSRSPVFSYYSMRESEGTAATGRGVQRVRETLVSSKRTLHWQYIPMWLAGLVVVAAIGYTLSIDTTPKIIALKDSANSTLLRDTKSYQQAAAYVLRGNILNRNKITINTQAIDAGLRKEFPELDMVVVTLPLTGRRPVIELHAAKPAFILTSSQEDYVIGTDGKAVLKASDAVNLDHTTLPQISDQSSLTLHAGTQAFTSDETAFISEIYAQLTAKNISIASMILPAVARQLDVKIKDKPYYVKFYTDSNARQAAGTFVATKEQLEREGVTPAEYIDVRVEERAYYK